MAPASTILTVGGRLTGPQHLWRTLLLPETVFWTLPVLWDGKMPPGVLFPQFPTARTPVFICAVEIAIIPPPRPAFVGGKGSPCEKEKGSLCEEES